MDLPADSFIDTVRDVFQEHLLPRGKLTYGPAGIGPPSKKWA